MQQLPDDPHTSVPTADHPVKPIHKKTKSESKDPLFEFRKMMLMCEMLLRREMRHEGEELLRKLMHMSTDMELFNERMQLYSMAALFNVKLKGKDAQKKYREEMADAIRMHNESVLSAGIFTSGQYQQLDYNGLKQLVETLYLLRQHYEHTGFLRIGYLYHFASLCYHAEMSYFKAAVFHGEKILELVKSKPLVFSGYNITAIMHKLAAGYLCIGEHNRALEKSREAVRQSSTHSQAHAQSLEMLFYSLLHQKELMALNDITARAQRNQFVKTDRFENAKWKMIQAGVLFYREEFKEAQKLLKGCCGLPREKAEWILYAQLLDVMCKAETGQHEWFYYRAEALRKSIYRYELKHRDKKNGRIGLIFRLLKHLHKNNMDFQLLLEEEMDALDLLRSSEGNYFWHPAGPELVRFDEWVQLKARKQNTHRRGKKLMN